MHLQSSTPRVPLGWRIQGRTMVWDGAGIIPCYYCGRPATCDEHVVPRVLVYMLPPGERPDFGVDTVPACKECNTGLAASVQDSLAARKAAAKQWLCRRYKKLLDMPAWSEDEIAELDDGWLRDYVCRSVVARAEVRRMLAW